MKDNDLGRRGLQLPRKGDRLLSDLSSDWPFNAFVRYPWDSIAEWLHYVEGYRLAADAAMAAVTEDRFKVDRLVFPIVFLYRHHFELVLKTIVVVGSKLYDQPCDPPTHHDIRSLWASAREIMEQRWRREDPELLDTVDQQIREFAAIDPGSCAFRYPVTTKGDPSLPNLERLNVRVFVDVAGRLSSFYTCCVEGLWNDLDLKEECLTEMAGYFGSESG